MSTNKLQAPETGLRANLPWLGNHCFMRDMLGEAVMNGFPCLQAHMRLLADDIGSDRKS